MAKKSKTSAIEAAREAARVAAAGRQKKDSSKDSGRRFKVSFGTMVSVIIVLGIVLVAYSYSVRDVAARPRQNEDHWHSAYGVYDCASENFLAPFQSQNDPLGIHSHQDGVMHIHPWFDRSSGRNATLGHFLDAMGASVTEEAITLPGGRELAAGEECGGKPSKIMVLLWRDINNLGRQAVVHTKDFHDIRFTEDGQAYTIARAVDSDDVMHPPLDHITSALGSSPHLQSRSPVEPLDEESDTGDGTESTTTTTAAATDETEPTAAPESEEEADAPDSTETTEPTEPTEPEQDS